MDIDRIGMEIDGLIREVVRMGYPQENSNIIRQAMLTCAFISPDEKIICLSEFFSSLRNCLAHGIDPSSLLNAGRLLESSRELWKHWDFLEQKAERITNPYSKLKEDVEFRKILFLHLSGEKSLRSLIRSYLVMHLGKGNPTEQEINLVTSRFRRKMKNYLPLGYQQSIKKSIEEYDDFWKTVSSTLVFKPLEIANFINCHSINLYSIFMKGECRGSLAFNYKKREYYILQGSTCQKQLHESLKKNKLVHRLREQWLAEQLLQDQHEYYIFTDNVKVPSSSAAACIVLGCNVNGRKRWINVRTGQTLQEYLNEKEKKQNASNKKGKQR